MKTAPEIRAGDASASGKSLRASGVNFTSVEVVLVLLTGALAFASDQFNLPVLNDPALLCAGLLLLVLGVERIVSRLAALGSGFGSFTQAVETYKAVVEQLWGLISLGIGLMLIARSLLGWLAPGAADSIWNGMLNSSTTIGLALGTVGLMTTVHGLIRTLAGSRGADDGRLQGLSDLLDRLIGAVTLLFGAALSVAGLAVLLAPDLIQNLLAQLSSMIVGP
jgi:hypothetical protein